MRHFSYLFSSLIFTSLVVSCKTEKLTYSIARSSGLIAQQNAEIHVYQGSTDLRLEVPEKKISVVKSLGSQETKQLLTLLECKQTQPALQSVDHPSYTILAYSNKDTISCIIPFEAKEYSSLQTLLDTIQLDH